MSRRRPSRRAAAIDAGPRSRRRTGVRRGRFAAVRPWILPGIFGAAVLGAIVVLFNLSTSSSSATGPQLAPPVLGDATAPVAIREYGDFQCPSCGAFFRAIEPRIREAYIATGKARLEWHDFAWIGPESRDAANAARCAQAQGQFWKYHDVLYGNQGGENSGAFSKDRLKALGSGLGLDVEALGACIDDRTYAGAVQADFDQVRSLGFTGTPTFVIGSHRVVGAQPFEVFAAAIEAALAGR